MAAARVAPATREERGLCRAQSYLLSAPYSCCTTIASWLSTAADQILRLHHLTLFQWPKEFKKDNARTRIHLNEAVEYEPEASD
jgi:hypothetical protein